MTLRELLQIELWSKRTTRKILIAIASLVVVLVVWIALERYWLTPAERKAGRVALAQIDNLQEFDTIGNEVFEESVKQTRVQIDAADKAAWTNRDRSVARALGFYLDLTKLDQEEAQQLRLRRQTHSPLIYKNAEPEIDVTEPEIDAAASGKRTRLLFRVELHAALD